MEALKQKTLHNPLLNDAEAYVQRVADRSGGRLRHDWRALLGERIVASLGPLGVFQCSLQGRLWLDGQAADLLELEEAEE